MESRTQDGGRSAGLAPELHDGGRAQPGDDLGLQFPALALSPAQSARRSNEYTDPPTLGPSAHTGSGSFGRQWSLRKAEQGRGVTTEDEEHDSFVVTEPRREHQNPFHFCPDPPSRLPDAANPCPRNFVRTTTSSGSSTSSGQRLLEPSTGTEVGSEAPGAKLEEELKPGAGSESGEHKRLCSKCGRCQCGECTRPRPLPSCWLCRRRCVCSAQSALDYGTCLCCAKCLFYHCSSDDEDVCADEPCSCASSRRCVRWTAMSILCPLLPCMLCYLPAKGCVGALQGCYDGATRPGCRCAGCRADATQAPFVRK